MRRRFTIAAAALLLVGAPAQAERAERDPDKIAVIAATILIFDRDCEKVSPKLEEAAGVATEVAALSGLNEDLCRSRSAANFCTKELMRF